MKRIALLIPTYQRNESLIRVIRQCAEFLSVYSGSNVYQICVTDSDTNNPLAKSLPSTGVKYSLNEGNGFDDNLLSFWRNHARNYDYVFSISDDDMFKPGANPLYILDAAVALELNAVLFNHRNYEVSPQGVTLVGALFYPDHSLEFNKISLLHNILTLLPRHVGLLYSTRLLLENLEVISRFTNTLHIYAAPLILACLKHSGGFFDYALCLFKTGDKEDGAWAGRADVLNGLAHFLAVLKPMLTGDLYELTEASFFYNYLGAEAWLRVLLKDGSGARSETDIRRELARIKYSEAELHDAL